MLNRSVVIVHVKKPFLNWLKTLPEPTDVSTELINQDNTAYLLPDLDYGAEEGELLERYYDLIFEEQLNGWWTDESAWPKERNLATFKKWFDVEFHSVVLDLVDQPLVDDE